MPCARGHRLPSVTHQAARVRTADSGSPEPALCANRMSPHTHLAWRALPRPRASGSLSPRGVAFLSFGPTLQVGPGALDTPHYLVPSVLPETRAEGHTGPS